MEYSHWGGYWAIKKNEVGLCAQTEISAKHKWLKYNSCQTCLVIQWLGIHQTWVWPLIQEDPTCLGATKPVHHSYRAVCRMTDACGPYSLCSATTGAPAMRSPRRATRKESVLTANREHARAATKTQPSRK